MLKAIVGASAVVALLAGISAAEAGSRSRDHIYADSFGNLIVYSRAGYKRIVVGKGHLAAELNAYSAGDPDEPNVVRLDSENDYASRQDCHRPPVLLKGRSYMYGLEEGEIPEPSGSCYDR